MKTVMTIVLGALMALPSFSQTVPPDYPQQALDAQIAAVRDAYEDVKAKAEKKLAKERAQKAAEAKRLAAKKAKAEAKARAKAEKLEARADENAEIDLELKRLKLKRALSKEKLAEAIDQESINRVKDIVDAKIQKLKQK